MRTLKRTYSVSELERYAESPEKYRAQYVIKRPVMPVIGTAQGLSATTRGDIIHKMIEIFGKGEKEPEKLFDTARIELEIGDITHDERNDILLQFKVFQNSRFANTNDSENEVPFLMKIGGEHVDGKLDMLIIPNLGTHALTHPSTLLGACLRASPWEIVDFKTGETFDPKESAGKYSLQMRAYALAVAKATGNAEGKVTIFFLSSSGGKEHQESIPEEKLRTTEKELETIIENIRNERY